MSRGPKKKRIKKVFYIVTEGETEECYISEFTQKYRCSAVKIKKIKPCGAEIIHRASDVWKHDKNKGLNPVPKVIVIDKDSLTEEGFNSILEDAKNKGIRVFFSNSAFEVWLLAHFEPITKGFLSANELKKRLSNYLRGDYKKGNVSQIRAIVKYSTQAFQNTRNVSSISYHTQCTNVGDLCQRMIED